MVAVSKMTDIPSEVQIRQAICSKYEQKFPWISYSSYIQCKQEYIDLHIKEEKRVPSVPIYRALK